MLGEFAKQTDERDAVHIAIIPMVAGEDLAAGDKVEKRGDFLFKSDNPIGIVDPFIKYEVRKNDRVWLCLFPQSVVGMRHHWVHPSFVTKDESERWLRNFCRESDCPPYEELLHYLNGEDSEHASCVIYNDIVHFSGTDAHGEIPPEFWVHVENILEVTFPVKPNSFSCSC